MRWDNPPLHLNSPLHWPNPPLQAEEGLTSLADYVARKKEGQTQIYYLAGGWGPLVSFFLFAARAVPQGSRRSARCLGTCARLLAFQSPPARVHPALQPTAARRARPAPMWRR